MQDGRGRTDDGRQEFFPVCGLSILESAGGAAPHAAGAWRRKNFLAAGGPDLDLFIRDQPGGRRLNSGRAPFPEKRSFQPSKPSQQ